MIYRRTRTDSRSLGSLRRPYHLRDTVAMPNLALDIAQGIILGVIPSVLTKSKAYGRLAIDVGLGIAGCVAMAWFLAPVHLRAEPTPFAEPDLVTGLGSVFAIAIGRLFG